MCVCVCVCVVGCEKKGIFRKKKKKEIISISLRVVNYLKSAQYLHRAGF